MACPMPRVAPVTMARLPWRPKSFSRYDADMVAVCEGLKLRIGLVVVADQVCSGSGEKKVPPWSPAAGGAAYRPPRRRAVRQPQ